MREDQILIDIGPEKTSLLKGYAFEVDLSGHRFFKRGRRISSCSLQCVCYYDAMARLRRSLSPFQLGYDFLDVHDCSFQLDTSRSGESRSNWK
jgi:hypothetical protein